MQNVVIAATPVGDGKFRVRITRDEVVAVDRIEEAESIKHASACVVEVVDGGRIWAFHTEDSPDRAAIIMDVLRPGEVPPDFRLRGRKK